MAPKLGGPDAPVNDGPTVGVNTSDRNAPTDSVDAASTSEPHKPGSSSAAKSGRSSIGVAADTQPASPRSNGTSNTNGNGADNSQLDMEVRSLNLKAPGMSRNDQSHSSSEDEGSVDDVERVEQQDRLNR